MSKRKTGTMPEVAFEAIDKDGNPTDLSVLEEADIAFDPTRSTMDLTKAEKRRTTALMMAIQAYGNIIIKDAEMYLAIKRESDRDGGPKIREATMHAMVEAAIQFDAFISGQFEPTLTEPEVVSAAGPGLHSRPVHTG